MTDEQSEIETGWANDRRRMTSTLVRLLHHQICWADKEDIVAAINGIEMDYEDYLQEKGDG